MPPRSAAAGTASSFATVTLNDTKGLPISRLRSRIAARPRARAYISLQRRCTVIGVKIRLTVALAILTIVGMPPRLVAQSRGAVGSRPHGSTNRPHAGPSRPSLAPIRQPLRSMITFQPTPFVPGHRPVPFRSSVFGLVLFDPYWWWAPGVVDESLMQPSATLSIDQRPTGGLQLDVEPRRALVYVDGLYVGMVDDFSGYYHHLETGAGLHVIEVIAPDYEPLAAEVMVSAGRTTTYRASLNRSPGRH